MTMLWHTDETEQALLEKKMVQVARARLSQRQISHWKVVISQTRLEDWFVSMFHCNFCMHAIASTSSSLGLPVDIYVAVCEHFWPTLLVNLHEHIV